MSVSKETYIVYGFRFGKEFTEDYWNKDFYDDTEYWNAERDAGKLKFITDGMNGWYTFFGQIIEIRTRGDFYEDKIQEIDLSVLRSKKEIYDEFIKLYPDLEITHDEIKLYYLPHYV
jgi:hypothetical protein